MTLRARHRLGVIPGACPWGWGRFWPPKSTELARAGPGGPSRYQWRALALAGGWFGFVPARDKRLSRTDSKPLCAMFECGQKLVLRRPRLMGLGLSAPTFERGQKPEAGIPRQNTCPPYLQIKSQDSPRLNHLTTPSHPW